MTQHEMKQRTFTRRDKHPSWTHSTQKKQTTVWKVRADGGTGKHSTLEGREITQPQPWGTSGTGPSDRSPRLQPGFRKKRAWARCKGHKNGTLSAFARNLRMNATTLLLLLLLLQFPCLCRDHAVPSCQAGRKAPSTTTGSQRRRIHCDCVWGLEQPSAQKVACTFCNKDLGTTVWKCLALLPHHRRPKCLAPFPPDRQCCPPLLLRLHLLQVYPFTPTPPAVAGPAAGLSPDDASARTCMAEAAAEAG